MQLQQRRPCRIPRQQPPQKQLVRLAALVVLAAALSASLVACPASAQRSSSSAASKSTSSAASAAAPPLTTSSSAPAAATTSSSDPAAAPAATTTTNNGNASPATTAAAASASSPAVWTFVPMAIYLRSPDGSLTGDPAVTQPVVPSSSPYYGAVTGKSASGGLTGWKKGVVIAGSIIGGLALLMGGSYLYTKHNDDKEKHQESTALSDFGATQPPRPSSDLPPKFDYAAGSGGDGLQKPEPAAGGGASAYSAPPPSKYAEDAAAYRPTSPPGSATAHSPHSAAPYGYPSTGAAAAAGGQATSVAAYGSYGATPPPTGYVPATNAYSAAYGAQQQQAYGYGAGYAAAGAYQQQYYASPPGPHPSSPYAAAQASPYAGSQASGYQQSGYRY